MCTFEHSFNITNSLRLPISTGPVVIQPPSEDRVSIFMSLPGGKHASLKIFSTGKVRCLKSDFSSLEHALSSAQAVIDKMATVSNSGMPNIRLQDAKVDTFYPNTTCIWYLIRLV